MRTATGSAPGRVNLIGEHLDYNGGRCLPIALPQRTSATVTRADVAVVRSSTTGGEQYVAGVLAALGVREPLEVQIESDVPVGAGLSSSAALECSVALAVDALLGLDRSVEELVDACIRAETEHVGAPTGGLDQQASLRCIPDHALLLDFADGSRRQVPFRPGADGLAVLVVDTGVAHDHVDGAYGSRRAECEEAARTLGTAHIAHAASLRELSGTLAARARHVVSEQARVDQFVDAVEARNWTAAGGLMTASHASLRDDFEVSCAELDRAVETVLRHGALGARMTGGGFGGSVVALVPVSELDDAISGTCDAFVRNEWEAPTWYVVEASAGGAVEVS